MDALDTLCRYATPANEEESVGHHVAVDIGAGTGKMTGLLVPCFDHVYAVEPSDSMREALAHLAEKHANLTVCAAHGEATGLSTASADLVVYAQSWHWVNEAEAAAEAQRILKPGGVLAAVWNQMDVSDPWIHRLTRIMRSGDIHRPDKPPSFGSFFEAPELHLFHWLDVMAPEEIIELGTTRASYLRSSTAGREKMQANLRWYLYSHRGYAQGEPVVIPYSTLVWIARLHG